jgi:hypothetical protein
MPTSAWRRFWRLAGWGALGAVIATAVMSLVMVGPVHARTAAVAKETVRTHQVAARAAFWPMVVGTRPTDATVTGRLAHDLRPLLNDRNAVRSLLHYYVRRDQYPHIESTLGLDVFKNEKATKSGDSDTLAQGYLTPEFVVKALQATPQNVGDLAETPPQVEGLGLLTWGTYVWLILAPAAAFLAYLLGAGLIVAWLRLRWQMRLSDEAREVYGYHRQLQDLVRSHPRSREAQKALEDAGQKLRWLAGDAPRELSRTDAAAMATAIGLQVTQATESVREGVATHRRLSG